MRYAFQNMSSQDPLEMQYANSRRRRAVSTARTAAASAQNSDAQYGGLDRGRASLYNSFAPDSTRPVGGVNRGMREFVSTHLPGAVVEEIVEEDDNLIDTINADLLSSRDRQSLHSLGSRSSSSGEQERTPGGALEQELQKRQREQLTRGSADTVGSGSSRQQQQQLQGLSVSYSARGGAPFEPGYWDINAATTDTVPAAKVTHAVGAGAAASAAADLTSTTTTTTGRTRQPSVSFVPSPSASPEQTSAAGTSRYSNTTSTANTNTAAASSSSVVASRSRSRSSSSSNSNNTPRTWGVSSSAEQHQEEDASEGEEGEREGGEVGDEEEFGQVFQNDFFNKFFPYLRKKGSVGAKKYQKEF